MKRSRPSSFSQCNPQVEFDFEFHSFRRRYPEGPAFVAHEIPSAFALGQALRSAGKAAALRMIPFADKQLKFK
jgi:hypothetical protein